MKLQDYQTTVVTNIKRNDFSLLHNGISISKEKRRRKLFRFNLVTIVYSTELQDRIKK